LPEIIVEYFELTSYKREMKSSILLKRVNSIPNIDNLNKFKGFFDEITVQDFQSVDIRYISTSLAEGGSMKY
jgi:hypothetical protein